MRRQAPQKAETARTDDENRLLQVLEMETNRISSLDSTIFTIKGWSITLVSALIGFSFASSSTGETISKGLLWVATASALIFMMIDIHFRKVQLSHVDTVRRIRKLLLELHTNTLEEDAQNIWGILWGDKHGVKSNIAVSWRDYIFTVLLYGIVVAALLYLVFIEPV